MMRLYVSTGLSVLIAIKIAVVPAYAQDSVPTLPPEPVRTPLLPQEQESGQEDPQQLLRTRVQMRLQRLDASIADILSRYDGRRPQSIVNDDPELAAARAERDRAWRTMQKALADQLKRQQRSDVIDRAPEGPVSDDLERRLRTQNRLELAECHLQLGQAGAGIEQFVQAREILESLSPERMSANAHPRWLYLRTNAAFELARNSEGDERRVYLREAQRLRDELRAKHPDSLLAITAETLLAGGFPDEVLQDVRRDMAGANADQRGER